MLSSLFFILALIFACFGLYQYLNEQRLSLRLKEVSQQVQAIRTDKKSAKLRLPSPDSLKTLVDEAGLDAEQATFWVLLSKILLATLAFVIFWPTAEADISQYIFVFVIAILAEMLPDWWLKQRAKSLLLQIRAQLPEVFDLLILCLQSGMSLDLALQRLTKEVRILNPKLSKELTILCQRLPVVPNRSQAFASFADRMRIKEIRQFVNLIQQSDEYGTPLVKSLRELADHSRQIYELEMEEQLGQLPARMTIPIMVFIIFPLIVLLAGPALYRLIDYLAG